MLLLHHQPSNIGWKDAVAFLPLQVPSLSITNAICGSQRSGMDCAVNYMTICMACIP